MGREGGALPELSRQRRYLVLAICCLSLFIVGLDITIINVALPSIGRDFRAPVSGLQWTIDAYLLVDRQPADAVRVDRRTGWAAAGSSRSALPSSPSARWPASLAPGLGWLIAFRALQAVGGSMLNPVAMAIVTNTFTDPAERARAIGMWGCVFGLSLALGPVVGGALVDSVGWRGVFWVNIPVGIAAIILTALLRPGVTCREVRRPDPFGQILVMITLVRGQLRRSSRDPTYGWGSARILLCFAVAAAASAVFLAYEPRRAEPLVDLRFFRSLPFSGAALTAVTGLAAFAGFLFLIMLYLQDVRGYRPLAAGLFLLPMAVVMAASAPLAGRVIARHGTRIPLLIAGAGIAAGGVLLTFLTATSPVWYVLVCCVVFGIGQGWLNAPITNNAVVRDAARRRPASRPGSRRPGARSAPPWAWRSWARCSPRTCTGRSRPGSRRPPGPAGGSSPPWAWSCSPSRLPPRAARAKASAARTALADRAVPMRRSRSAA